MKNLGQARRIAASEMKAEEADTVVQKEYKIISDDLD